MYEGSFLMIHAANASTFPISASFSSMFRNAAKFSEPSPTPRAPPLHDVDDHALVDAAGHPRVAPHRVEGQAAARFARYVPLERDRRAFAVAAHDQDGVGIASGEQAVERHREAALGRTGFVAV